MYANAAVRFVAVRDRHHPYYVQSYCRATECCGRKLTLCGRLQVFAHSGLLLVGAAIVAMTYWNGVSTPKKIFHAVTFTSLMLGILFLLMHTLEVDRNRVYFAGDSWPTLEYHWLWGIVCLAIVWGCGLGFYFSVWTFLDPWYYAPHVLAWAALAGISMTRLPEAFPYRAEQKAFAVMTPRF
jgi:hypothetical protein